MYYIYDCHNEVNYVVTRSELHRFANTEGTVFGNFQEQIRNVRKEVFICGSSSMATLGHKLIKYIVYDEFYELIDYKVLEDWAFNSYCKQYKQFRRYRGEDCVFRNAPVPGIHKYSNTNYYRRPKTHNELKANSNKDHIEYLRQKRYVPSSWDDIHIGARSIKRSWKKNKKKETMDVI